MLYTPRPGHGNGWIEVVTGCMFSGKTSEVIERGAKAIRARHELVAFKHRVDGRYHPVDLASHSGARLTAFAVEHTSEMRARIKATTQVIVIDEWQFFLDEDLIPFVREERRHGRRIIVSGLNMDYTGKPFGQMPTLLTIANEIETRYAICTVCGEQAHFSQRVVPSSAQMLVGESEAYEARCERDWDPDGVPMVAAG